MFDDMFKPYSKQRCGDLGTYLLECENGGADNLFSGSEHFFAIRDLDIIIPKFTSVRVNQSPIPDLHYIVTDNFELRSFGRSNYNMSLMGAAEGTYNPRTELENQLWSIHNLNIYNLPSSED